MSRERTTREAAKAWLWPVACVAGGLALGAFGRRALGPGEREGKEALWEETGRSAKSDRGADAAAPPPNTVRSGDTVEDLVADRSATRLAKIELWLLDADAAQVEQLWEKLKSAKGVTYRDMDALFIRWTALDPGTAIAAAKGTHWNHIPWWGWARSEPERAFATARRDRPEMVGIVFRSIGQSNPDLALRLAEAHPETMNSSAVSGIAYGLGQRDSRQAVEFARSHGSSASDQMETWAQREPDQMLAWLVRNEVGGTASSDARQGLKMAAREHPERIGEFLDLLPAGALRQQLMREGIAVLSASDPGAALALVERAKGTAMEAEWYAELGEALAYHDPERSMELFAERIADGVPEGRTVLYPDGRESATNLYTEWVKRLGETNPEEVIALTREQAPGLENTVVSEWMGRDPDGFGNWLRLEPAGLPRDVIVASFVQQLARDGPAGQVAALHWLATVSDAERRSDGTRQVVRKVMAAERDSGGESLLNSPDLPAGVAEIYADEVRRQHRADGGTP